MLILGIETSCDEASAAVVEDGVKIRSNIIYSQDEVHAKYGGVVPELASRKHIETIVPVVKEALEQAGITLKELDGIAVTAGPGLIGSLLVGLSLAKSLAYFQHIPYIGINHLEGHLTSIFLEEELSFPYIGMVVSGGHTNLYLVQGFGDYLLLGKTRDDAAGEAFDKVAKLLGLGYPGGVVIDRLAKDGDNQAFSFPRSMIKDESLDFSFSGIKTAVANFVKERGMEEVKKRLNDVAASFQQAVVEVLVSKAVRAARSRGVDKIVLSGGVASNSALRSLFKHSPEKENIKVYFPSPLLCTDNGAMIAGVGYRYLKEGKSSPLSLNARARWDLPTDPAE
ncbi:MAG: tRNA (adenosine(37)-N6)-threonylcarbamoyltransferase complex transferase subunit TsaD [Deltaproteobacteria bacterium]|nr:MAG: tRNA (adenosine(37)-N6)-threonylcarbamoyltransferase complex transferase subunit TsaD [Deltaproteobacteria bacterium]